MRTMTSNPKKAKTTRKVTCLILSALFGLAAGCGAQPDAGDDVESRSGAVTASQASSQTAGTASTNATLWTQLQGAAATVPAPEMTIKLNDNLSGVTELLVPALAHQYELDDVDLPKLPLLEDTTKADLGILGDIFFACHDDQTPIVLDLRSMHMDMGIDADAVLAVFDGTPATGSDMRFDADLPRFTFDGTIYLDWPATKTSLLCTFANDYHFEIPFSIRGAHLDSTVVFAALNNTLKLGAFSLEKLSVDDVSFQSDALDLASDIGLAVADTVASVYQKLKDGVSKADLQPVNGLCSSPGSTPTLASCLGAVASAYVAKTLNPANSDFQKMIRDAVKLPLPAAVPLRVGAASFSVAPEITAYTEHDDNDNAIIKATLLPSSTAPKAACAAGLVPAPPHGSTGTFDPQKDVDMVIPFDMIETVLYEVTRQGALCLPPTAIGTGTASIDATGAITVSNHSNAMFGSAIATATVSTGGATPAPAPTPDLFSTHPYKLSFVGTASGSITVSAELGWDVSLNCTNQVVLQLVSARRVALSGSVSLPGKRPIAATDPAVQAQIDAAIASLPGRVGPVPLGPAIVGLPAGVYLNLAPPNTSDHEIQLGLALRDSPVAACVPSSGGGSTSTGYGNDVVTTGNPPSVDFGTVTGTTGTTAGSGANGNVGGAGTGAATTQSSTGGGTSTRP